MMGATHNLVALSGAVVIASQTASDYTEAGVLIGASVACAKLPDIDCRLPLRHRGPATHSLLAAVSFTAVLLSLLTMVAAMTYMSVDPELLWLAGAGAGLGIVLHVLADALTISGVPLLWPVVRRDVHLLPHGFRVRTDGPVEAVLAFLLAAGLVGFLYLTYGHA